MIRINLLPHRQIKREERQRTFNLLAGLSVIAAMAIIFLGYTVIGAQVSSQQERNQRLEDANAKLEKDIAEIKDLKEKIQDLLSRKQVVENLQTNRSQAVIVLDELARKLPEGTYLKSIKQNNLEIEIVGVADTNARVATLVRNMSESEYMASANLVEIKSTLVNGLKYNEFNLKVNLKPPVDPNSETKSKENKDNSTGANQ